MTDRMKSASAEHLDKMRSADEAECACAVMIP